jgi:hypothetical protein
MICGVAPGFFSSPLESPREKSAHSTQIAQQRRLTSHLEKFYSNSGLILLAVLGADV